MSIATITLFDTLFLFTCYSICFHLSGMIPYVKKRVSMKTNVNRAILSEFLNGFICVEKCIATPLICIGSAEMWKLRILFMEICIFECSFFVGKSFCLDDLNFFITL